MKKIVILIFSIFISIILIPKVNAVSVSKVASDYYYTRYHPDGTKYSDRYNVHYIDGSIVYCIEPGVKLGSDYNIEDYNIPYENKMRIILAAYYGYFYGNYKDIRYALATQSIIWKEILGTYPVFSTELWEKGTILDLSFFINNIEKKINDNNKLPNLVPNKEIVVGNVVMFRDTNNVINSYDYSEYTNSGSLINGPTIYFPEAGIHTFKLNRNRYYDHNYRIYVDSDKQKLIMPGNIPELDYEFAVDVKPLNVHFEFKDSETNKKINGVKLKFNGELLNDNDTYTINRYTICTIQFESVPDKYELDTSIKSFDNYSSSDITLNFKLKPVYNYFTINKTYDDIYPEEDAIFELINNENNKLQGVYVTDSNGSFKMHIKYGTYTLNQLKGIQGYTLITETINNTHPNISGNEYTINLNDKRLENKSDIIQDSFTITPENTEILDNNQVDNIDDHPYTLELVSTGNNISLLLILLSFSSIYLLKKKIIAI